MEVFDVNFFLTSFIVLQGQCSGGTFTEYNNLYNTALTGYNKDGRPLQDQNHVMIVVLDFSLLTIADLDDASSKLVTVGLFTILWRDEVITWNQSLYENTKELHIDESLVWKPSMALINTMSINVGLLGFKQSKIEYSSDGVAFWHIADRYQTTCDFDTTYFPFDKQTCELKIVAWDYTIQGLFIYPLKPTVDLTYFSENGAWELVSTETRSEYLAYYSVVVFSLNLKRRPLYFVIYRLIPVFTMLFLNTLVFILPSDSGERVGYAINCLLALAVFLTLVSEGLPGDSEPMPVIGYVLTVYLIISAIICVLTIFILRLHHKEENKEIPPSFRKMYNILTCATCKKRSRTVEAYLSTTDSENVEENDKHKKSSVLPLTWKKLSSRLDFICFISSLSSVITVGVVYFVIVMS
ncbi:acetylcholine receptor subunit alpha-like [Magallana gigas]|uniref:acetylcholine receptor subunit alpha-like n=1 Tax=Magallana gigas TaxID=29159 RepID=UPI0033406963